MAAAVPPVPDTCATCAYFRPVTPNFGGCRRYAPGSSVLRESEKTGQQMFVVWPAVMKTEWCGDWKKV